MSKGYMRISRDRISEWHWLHNQTKFYVFFRLLLKANYKDLPFEKTIVKRGQLVFSYDKLAAELGTSLQTLRTTLKDLQDTNDIIIQSTRKSSLLTICEYDSWQEFVDETNTQLTYEQHTNNIQLTLSKEIEELKKENNILKEELTKVSKKKSNTFIPPTIDEVSEYVKEKGFHFDAEAFVNFYESKGWFIGKNKMKDWKAACRTWERKRKDNSQSREEIGVIYQGSNTGKYDNMDLWE